MDDDRNNPRPDEDVGQDSRDSDPELAKEQAKGRQPLGGDHSAEITRRRLTSPAARTIPGNFPPKAPAPAAAIPTRAARRRSKPDRDRGNGASGPDIGVI